MLGSCLLSVPRSVPCVVVVVRRGCGCCASFIVDVAVAVVVVVVAVVLVSSPSRLTNIIHLCIVIRG
jgi:hypothetical protein